VFQYLILILFNPLNRPFIPNSGLSAAKNGIGMNGCYYNRLMQSSVHCRLMLIRMSYEPQLRISSAAHPLVSLAVVLELFKK